MRGEVCPFSLSLLFPVYLPPRNQPRLLTPPEPYIPYDPSDPSIKHELDLSIPFLILDSTRSVIFTLARLVPSWVTVPGNCMFSPLFVELAFFHPRL